jgi:hypothetical protein
MDRYSSEVKEMVLALGNKGKTYAEIREEFDIPKSTLSTWFKNAGKIPDRAKQLEHLKRARALSVLTKNRQRQGRLGFAKASAQTIAEQLPIDNATFNKGLLAMLYWAEGTKSPHRACSMTFTNTDPALMLFYITLLRSTYTIEESRLRVRVHIHYYHSENEAIGFWSQLLKIPKSQFGKIYVKNRSKQKKFRENFQGICFVMYGSEAIRQEVLALGREIAARY